MKAFPRTVAVVLVPLGLVVGGAWLFTRPTAAPAGTFRTTRIGRGDLVARISATGTLEPEEVVDVGAQVAGQILSFGKDQQGKPIDYGSAVRAGTVLAKIDDSLYTLDVAQAQSTLAQAQASVQRARGRPGADAGQAGPGGQRLEAGAEAGAGQCAGPDQLRRLQGRLRNGQGQPGGRRGDGRAEPRPRSSRRRPRCSGPNGTSATAPSSRRSTASSSTAA